MASVIKRKWGYQSIITVSGHPRLTKSFKSKIDAKRWAIETELKIRREDAGIAKVKYPTFHEIGLRYIADVLPLKKSFQLEKNIIVALDLESWSSYPINKINANVLSKWRDKQLESVCGSTVNRKLDVISTIFTSCKKEWGLPVDNPVMAMRRPKRSEPRDRRFTDQEIKKLLQGNKTEEKIRQIIEIALETGMRCGEILRISTDHLKGRLLVIPITKTKPRTIPLTKRAVDLIKRADLPFNLSTDQVGKRFRRLCNYYGIKDAKFHDLRHQALSNFMFDKKLDVASTMLIAGHSDPRMLLRIYNNVKAEMVASLLNN